MPSQAAFGVRIGAWTGTGAAIALVGASGCFISVLGTDGFAVELGFVSTALAGLDAFKAISAARALSAAIVFKVGLDAVWSGVDATVSGFDAKEAFGNAVGEAVFCSGTELVSTVTDLSFEFAVGQSNLAAKPITSRPVREMAARVKDDFFVCRIGSAEVYKAATTPVGASVLGSSFTVGNVGSVSGSVLIASVTGVDAMACPAKAGIGMCIVASWSSDIILTVASGSKSASVTPASEAFEICRVES